MKGRPGTRGGEEAVGEGAVGAGGRTGGAGRARPDGPLPVLRPRWNAPAGVRVLCTTRAGGVSEPPYDALNLGLHVGDESARVRENRRLLIERLALPSPPLWLAQVHGARVVGIDRPGDGSAAGGRPAPPEADGAWTERRGVVLAVLTADCLPVVITDATGTRVAIAHAGWRGLAGGVLEATLAVFPPGAALHVWLGPAIGPHAFEVGTEVREAFTERDAAHACAFVPTGAPGKFRADLYALARRELRRLRGDAVRVSGGDRCTHSEPAHFHSHRRDGARSGRMATLAWLG